MRSTLRLALLTTLLAVALPVPVPASETGEFQQRVGEYTSGLLSPADFLDICTVILQDAPLKDKALESQVRRYRGAVNIQLNNYFAAVQDAVYLAKLPDSKLAGMHMLALIAHKRSNYPKAMAITDAILEEMREGNKESGIGPDHLRELRAIQEKELKALVSISAQDLARQIAQNPRDATARYAGKTLLVTGNILSLPAPENNNTALVLEASPPLSSFLDKDEVHFFKGKNIGDSIRIVGPLKELHSEAVISPAHYLEEEEESWLEE